MDTGVVLEKTRRGFREIHLNERRNDIDFRTNGGNAHCLDKSVHQSQALELPGARILLSLGQHPLCRKLIIFDPDWLLETSREDDFSLGLGKWSVQQYLKSVAGNFRGVSGHCAYNRRAGAALVPHPDGKPREVLQIARHPDARLAYEIEGAVWNFPCWRRGRLSIRLRMPRGSRGGQLCLMDRWFNPVDPVVAHFARHVLRLDGEGCVNGVRCLPPDSWVDLALVWDESGARWGGVVKGWIAVPVVHPSLNGVSYLHIQGAMDGRDDEGILVESVRAEKI